MQGHTWRDGNLPPVLSAQTPWLQRRRLQDGSTGGGSSGSGSTSSSSSSMQIAVILAVSNASRAVVQGGASLQVVSAGTVDTSACISTTASGAQRGVSTQSVRSLKQQSASSTTVDDPSACAASSLAVLTPSSQLVLLVRVKAPVGSLPGQALHLVGCQRLSSGEAPQQWGDYQQFEVTVNITSPGAPCNASVAAGALASAAGLPTAASNTIVATWRDKRPRALILSTITTSKTHEENPLILIDFGTRVLGAIPSHLFTYQGLSRCGGGGALG